MACYRVVGAADCPYFARAERLGRTLKATFPASKVEVEMRSPAEWSEFSGKLCQDLSWDPPTEIIKPKPEDITLLTAATGTNPSPASEVGVTVSPIDELELVAVTGGKRPIVPSSSAVGRVIVYDPVTKRVVGGENAFKQELFAKYAIVCDVDWDAILAIAAENAALFGKQRKYCQNRPLGVVIAGPPLAGKRTLAHRLAAKHGFVVVCAGALLAEAAASAALTGATSPQNDAIARHLAARTAELSAIAAGAHDEFKGAAPAAGAGGASVPTRTGAGAAAGLTAAACGEAVSAWRGASVRTAAEMLAAAPAAAGRVDALVSLRVAEKPSNLIADALVLPLVIARLKAPDVSAKGFVLEGFPRTTAQAQALVQAGIPVDVVIRVDLDVASAARRVASRVFDPLTQQSYSISPTVTAQAAAPADLVGDGQLVRRADDCAAVAQIRRAQYQATTLPVIEKAYGARVVVLDGKALPEAVAEGANLEIAQARAIAAQPAA